MIELRKNGRITEHIPFSKYSFSQSLLIEFNSMLMKELSTAQNFKEMVLFSIGYSFARKYLWV